MFLKCNQQLPVRKQSNSQKNNHLKIRRAIVGRCALLSALLMTVDMEVMAQVLPASPISPNLTLDYKPKYVIDQELLAIDLEGNTQISTTELTAAAQEFIGKKPTASDVEQIRTRLTRMYIDRGYINSGAVFVIPAEPSSNNRLRFRIIEGHLKEIRVQGQERLHAAYLQSRLPASSDVLNMNRLREQFQLLLQDPLFERIQSRLMPTGQLGEAVLELDVVRKSPVSYTLFANNYRSPAIGEAVLGGSLNVRNLSGWGDVFDAQIGKSDGAAPYHLAWNLPLLHSNQSIQLSWDHGRSSVVEAPLDLVDIHSQTSALDLKWNLNLLNSLPRRFDIGVALARKRTHSRLLGEDFSFSPGEVDGRSQTQVIKLSQDWTERGEDFGFLAHSIFQFGRNRNLMDDTSLEQQIVPPRQYWLWNAQVQWLQQLPDWKAQLLMRAQWQWSPQRLIPMEKMALGGNATVRGFRESTLLRDQAQVLSVELHKTFYSDAERARRMSAFLFVDSGRGKNQEEAAQSLRSYGLGIKTQFASWSADVVYAKPIRKKVGEGSQQRNSLQDQGLQLQIAYKFN